MTTDVIDVAHWQDVDRATWQWPNFSPEELACRHCGKLLIEVRALNTLQRLRHDLGRPFIINSAYRCPIHNRAVGGAKHSQHLLGRAFDVSMTNHNPVEFERAARAIGFTGVGLYPPRAGGGWNFIHIDARPVPVGVSWGQAFPDRAVTRFAPEPSPRPVAQAARDGGVVVGAIAAGHVAATSALPTIAPALPAIWVGYISAGLAVIGVGLVVYRTLTRDQEQ